MRKFVLAVIALVALVAFVAACSDDKTATSTAVPSTATQTTAPSTATASSTTTSVPSEEAVEVEVKEFAVAPTPPSARAGKVRFDVSNAGTVVHEFVIIKSDLDPKSLPLVADGSLVDEDQADHVGEIEDIAPASTANGEFTLEPGKYILICNVAGHYSAGMNTAFTVE